MKKHNNRGANTYYQTEKQRNFTYTQNYSKVMATKSRYALITMAMWHAAGGWFMAGLLLCRLDVSHGITRYDMEHQLDPDNITGILNQLLNGYDMRLRPDYGGPPTIVQADMNIRSMGPISEEDMTYSLDTYFRQTWTDKRLQFEARLPQLAVHIKVLEKIWKPDTFFYNGRMSQLHTITTPNKLLRIKRDGTVLYSMRLTIKASCPMYLHYFPVDKQKCPLQFGSYGYPRDQLLYVWKNGNQQSIVTAKDMRLSQFDLAGHPAWNFTVNNRSGEYSVLKVNFQLQRHMGYFLIQVYVPCTLIVVLSWVSFWINREATADRVGLGVTTVLTLTTLCLDTRNDLPKVPYATALDCFVILCFGFVLASLLEFAGVHYFTKSGSGEVSRDPESEDEMQETSLATHTLITSRGDAYMTHNSHDNHTVCRGVRSTKDKVSPGDKQRAVKKLPENCLKKFALCLIGSSTYRRLLMKLGEGHHGINSVSMIDRASRVLFPFSFITLNVMYWVSYTR